MLAIQLATNWTSGHHAKAVSAKEICDPGSERDVLCQRRNTVDGRLWKLRDPRHHGIDIKRRATEIYDLNCR